MALTVGYYWSVLRRGVLGSQPVLAVLEHPLRLALDLPDPLARDLKLLAELGEGRGLLPVEAVPPNQDAPMALGEPLYGRLEAFGLHISHHLTGRIRGPLILEELT